MLLQDAQMLALRAMVEVAQSGADNIEVAVLTRRYDDIKKRHVPYLLGLFANVIPHLLFFFNVKLKIAQRPIKDK